MSQVNVNEPPPPPQPPRRPSSLPVIAFVVLLALVGAGVLLTRFLGQQNASGPAATPTARPAATHTARARGGPASTATPRPSPTPAATATTGAAAAATPTGNAGAATTPTTNATPAGVSPSAVPSNPTRIKVRNGTCGHPVMRWEWYGARNATSYDVVLYNPTTSAEFREDRTTHPYYEKRADPGATLVLKVRARNGLLTARTFYTPGGPAQAHVEQGVSNPTSIVRKGDHFHLAWDWYPAPRATGYDVVLYHYAGSAYTVDKETTVSTPSFSDPGSRGITYYLKVRSRGRCAPTAYFTPGGPAGEHL